MARTKDSKDIVRRDFFDALERISSGNVINSDLRKLLDQGKLKVNVSNVAKEAGRSRTLIAQKGTKYSDIREAIIGASKAKGHQREPMGEAKAKNEATKQELRRLKQQVHLLASENAALQERVRIAEKTVNARQGNSNEAVILLRRNRE